MVSDPRCLRFHESSRPPGLPLEPLGQLETLGAHLRRRAALGRTSELVTDHGYSCPMAVLAV